MTSEKQTVLITHSGEDYSRIPRPISSWNLAAVRSRSSVARTHLISGIGRASKGDESGDLVSHERVLSRQRSGVIEYAWFQKNPLVNGI